MATLAPVEQRRRALAEARAKEASKAASPRGAAATTSSSSLPPSSDQEEKEGATAAALAAAAADRSMVEATAAGLKKLLAAVSLMVSSATGVDLPSLPFGYKQSDEQEEQEEEAASFKVAVKVQHPNLAAGLELDMALLKWVASWGGHRVASTVDQFATNFECQLDFKDEAENLRKFGKHFNGPFWGSMVRHRGERELSSFEIECTNNKHNTTTNDKHQQQP